MSNFTKTFMDGFRQVPFFFKPIFPFAVLFLTIAILLKVIFMAIFKKKNIIWILAFAIVLFCIMALGFVYIESWNLP